MCTPPCPKPRREVHRHLDALDDAASAVSLDQRYAKGFSRKGHAEFFLGRFVDAENSCAGRHRVEIPHPSRLGRLIAFCPSLLLNSALMPDSEIRAVFDRYWVLSRLIAFCPSLLLHSRSDAGFRDQGGNRPVLGRLIAFAPFPV